MNRNYSLIALYLLAALSCREPDTNRTGLNRNDITDSVRATLNNYFADVKKEGLTAEFKYLDSSLDFFWVPPGYGSAISYDSVAAILRKYQPFYTLIDNSWESLLIRPVTNELASYTGKVRSITRDTSGKKSDITLIETGLIIKRKTGWKLLNGQTSVVERK